MLKKQVKSSVDSLMIDELTIREGDVITITLKGGQGWWTGSLNGKKGMFPANVGFNAALFDISTSKNSNKNLHFPLKYQLKASVPRS